MAARCTYVDGAPSRFSREGTSAPGFPLLPGALFHPPACRPLPPCLHSAVAQIKKYRKDEKYVDLDCSGRGYLVSGDVKLVLFDQDMYSSDDKVR